MKLIPMSPTNKDLLNSINSHLTVKEKLLVCFDGHKYTVSYVPVEAYIKTYQSELFNFSEYFSSKKDKVFFLMEEGRLLGQIILRESWNKYCYVDDIRIDHDYKGQGYGSLLLRAGEDYAKENGLKGMMLESQDINSPACKFYLKNGYQIGSIDPFKYKLLNDPIASESAITFYKIFQ